MWAQFRQWRLNIPIADPLQRDQAAVLQSFLFILIAFVLLGVPTTLTATATIDRIVGVSALLLLGLVLLAAIILLRRGAFMASVVLVVIGMTLLAGLTMVPTSLEGSRAIFTFLAIPLVLAGILGGRQILVLALLISVLMVIGITVLGITTPTLVGYSPETYDPRFTCVSFLVMAGVLTLLLDRFSGTLRGALAQASTREQELERLRVSLEQQVYERTAALQVTVDQLRTSQATIDALGAPILPVLPGVLVAPLIGTIDAARLTTIADKLLAAVAQQRAHAVILDLTGVADMDAAIADGFRHLSSAVGLIGARTLVVGISPAVAQALVDLDVDLTAVSVAASLQEAVALLQSAGQQTPQRRL